MSVVTTLALMATALKAAVGKEQQAHMKTRASLWPELDGSAAELAEAKAKLAELERERDDWRARAEAWRERALVNIPAPQPAGPDFRPPELAQRQFEQWYQAQKNAQQHYGLAQQAMQQNLQNAAAYGGQGMMLLGSQQMSALDPEMWCNCVPSRAQVWAAQGDGA